MDKTNEILSDITVYMKYAKYIPELNRRETWTELVDRNKAMHIKTYPELKEEIEEFKVPDNIESLLQKRTPVDQKDNMSLLAKEV